MSRGRAFRQHIPVLTKRSRHPVDSRCAACRPRLTAAQGPRVEQRAILARTIQKSWKQITCRSRAKELRWPGKRPATRVPDAGRRQVRKNSTSSVPASGLRTLSRRNRLRATRIDPFRSVGLFKCTPQSGQSRSVIMTEGFRPRVESDSGRNDLPPKTTRRRATAHVGEVSWKIGRQLTQRI